MVYTDKKNLHVICVTLFDTMLVSEEYRSLIYLHQILFHIPKRIFTLQAFTCITAYESKKLKINLLAEMQTQSARSNQVEACSCTCFSQIGSNCTACFALSACFHFSLTLQLPKVTNM